LENKLCNKQVGWPIYAIMECGGRASRDSAKRRHRFERFTTAIVRTSFKAVSPVAVAPSATALQKIVTPCKKKNLPPCFPLI